MRRRARAATVISEAIGIPPHLSLSNGVRLVVEFPAGPSNGRGQSIGNRKMTMSFACHANDSAHPVDG